MFPKTTASIENTLKLQTNTGLQKNFMVPVIEPVQPVNRNQKVQVIEPVCGC
jgi:hypothetical protein